MYRCPRCGAEVDHKSYMENKCPKCRYRILFKNVPETTRIINEIKVISLDDHIEFILNDVSEIMDNMEYPGIRIHMNSKLENLTLNSMIFFKMLIYL